MVVFLSVFLTVIPAPFHATESDSPASKRPPLLCPVTGKPAQTSFTVAYRGGKVAFSDKASLAKFRANPDDYNTMSNLQLVASGQAKQVACPVTGEKLHPKRFLTIQGIRVGFCCLGCLGKVADEKQKEIRLYYVFGNNAFRRGFKMGK